MGTVVFIGAGPGQADLITLRGAARLREAQVVLYDALVDPALRDFAPQAEWIDVGKRGFVHATQQAHINDLLLEQAQRHERVVRLKGGDPSLFGRLEEELLTLHAAGIACEVVPGVTAALAAAAATQRPLTRRGSGRSVSLATAMTLTGALRSSLSADTEVFYMAGRQLGELARHLLGAGWPATTPVHLVSQAGWPEQAQSTHLLGALGALVADGVAAGPAGWELEAANALHRGRPTVAIVGAGAAPLTAEPAAPASAPSIAATTASEGATSAPAPSMARADPPPGVAKDTHGAI